MISRHAIRKFANEVARRFKPEKIILFGSYAYGKPTPDSDVDLLVVMPQRQVRRGMSVRMRWAVPRTFPLDLLVRSRQEVNRRLGWGDCFLQEVTSKGKVLYEADHSYYAVDFRYPGHSATLREARTAMSQFRLTRVAARRSLGLKT